jgi:hypothetical protein
MSWSILGSDAHIFLCADQQAEKLYTCDIVSLSWLLESVEAQKRLAEKAYLFDPSNPVVDNSSNTGGNQITAVAAAANGDATTNNASQSSDNYQNLKKRLHTSDADASPKKAKKAKNDSDRQPKGPQIEVDERYPNRRETSPQSLF